ncbi:hypothetical protein D0868_04497 [Hortaea werneckii]|uniref:Uncharacterized protein n=1 Tax=Hortaea werneckii TaxID=91943 RepID=A0A3M6Z167_HORWE|nr:hypothetical protein D0868_04497 [Hortaea werneckii]RMY38993.1 hypothetical protein D0866_02218 [Hortaea werneckii]
MACQTSSQGAPQDLNSAQLLDDMTHAQLKRSKQLTGNPIKMHFGNALYNFFIIDPASAKFGEQRLKQSLEGYGDGSGSLQLPLLRQAFDPDFLDDTAVSFLGRAGRAPKPGSAFPDDAAKVILKNVYAVQFSLSEPLILKALEYTHSHGKKIFKWLTWRVQVFVQRCGGPAFWLEAGYKARQEVVYDMIHAFPGHITLAEAFPYAQIWATPKATDLVKEFRALIVYQIAQLVEDTFNYVTTTVGCKNAVPASAQRACLLPDDLLDYLA